MIVSSAVFFFMFPNPPTVQKRSYCLRLKKNNGIAYNLGCYHCYCNYQTVVYLSCLPPPQKKRRWQVPGERETKSLGKLLLDEKGAQMRELPYASYGEDNELDQRPANDARVCVFGLIAEFGFTLLL